tara:strand:+ start:247 stop:567 length:321 start_codon:yes stop_codon:yes gene_type:complete
MTKRAHKGSDGKYHIKGSTYDELVGSRAQVFHGTAYKTSHGKHGLRKHQLKKNTKTGRIVSLRKSKTAKKEQRLKKHGWTTKKGKFGAVQIKNTTAKRKTRRQRKR